MSRRSWRLGADLVIAGGDNFNPPEAIQKLRDLGVPVLVLFAPDVRTALADMSLIGRAVGRADEADGARRIDPGSVRRGDRGRRPGLPVPRVYYELDASNGFFGPAPDYFGTEMIRVAGGDPLTSGTPGVYQIEAEQILSFDPQVILLGDAAYGVTPDQVASRPGLGHAVGRCRRRRPADRRRHRDPARAAPGRRRPDARPGDPPRPGSAGSEPVLMATTPVPAGAGARAVVAVPARRLGRAGWLAVAGVATLVVVLVAGVVLGSADLPPSTTLAIVAHRLLGIGGPVSWPATAEAIVIDLRLPRVLTAMVVGAGLAVAGATFQGLLRNPLADPYVLGTASGAALGAAIAVLIPVRARSSQFGLLHGLAFIGALVSVTVVYRLSRTSALAPLTSLLLTGYAVGSLLAAGLAMAMYLSGTGLRRSSPTCWAGLTARPGCGSRWRRR